MFVSLFRSFAAANPVKTAVEWRSGAVSYGELALQVRRVSKYLALMGVAQGSRVVMALPGNLHTLVLYHALADCGAVLIPLSRTLSPDAIMACLKDARPQFCLVAGELEPVYQQVCAGPGPSCQVVSGRTRPYSLEAMFRQDPPCIRPLPRIRPDHELMIRYHWHQGQGERGHWSKVVQTHRHHIQCMLSWSRTAGLIASDTTLCVGAPGESMATELLALTALASGQTLYLMEEGEASPGAIIRLIHQKGIRILAASPACYRHLIDVPQSEDTGVRPEPGNDDGCQQLSELESLRMALCDVRSLEDDLAPAFQRRFAVRLNYVFSLPEAALALVDLAPDESHGAIAIGLPIEGVQARVKGLEPHQDGIGELWLRSGHFAERTPRDQPLCNDRGWLATGVLVSRRKGRFYLLQPSIGVREAPEAYRLSWAADGRAGSVRVSDRPTPAPAVRLPAESARELSGSPGRSGSARSAPQVVHNDPDAAVAGC